ncbi:hypothetical protein ACH46N_29170 [Streptomyces pristinaespiralis]
MRYQLEWLETLGAVRRRGEARRRGRLTC